MKDMHPDILELLVLRATEGISREQEQTLQALLEEHGIEDTLELDLAAAAASNAFALKEATEYEDAPEHLKARLQADANRFFGQEDSKVVALKPKQAERPGWNWGWATAAALMIVMIATKVADFAAPPDEYEQARQRLIAEYEDTQVIPWAAPEDPTYAQVRGDVVWNDARQEGYMLLTGMPVNDPGESQYQLWVVDPDRDANPVDGGVFDIPAGEATVIVPINAKLAVDEPVLFAITREQPGGVVVSQGPLLVVASAG